jgi:hypothetical protein
MKRIYQISLFSIIVLLFSCDVNNDERTLPESTGKSGELIIVVDTSYSNGETGRALEQVFIEDVYGVPRSEPIFNVVTLPQKGFTRMLQTVRNILEMDINSANKAEIQIKEEVWSKGQLVVVISAPSDKVAASILLKNKDKLQKLFNEAELKRSSNRLLDGIDQQKTKALLEKHNFSLNVPAEYFVSIDSNNFFFVRKNRVVGEHQILQGVMVYEYPYDNDSAFNAKVIVDSMETFISNIKGQPKGFMAVEMQYPVLKEEVNFKEKYAVKLSGLWKMEGIFMGGSFINYTFLNADENKVIGLYGFVYAPKFNHREYLRELEALINTFHEKIKNPA